MISKLFLSPELKIEIPSEGVLYFELFYQEKNAFQTYLLCRLSQEEEELTNNLLSSTEELIKQALGWRVNPWEVIFLCGSQGSPDSAPVFSGRCAVCRSCVWAFIIPPTAGKTVQPSARKLSMSRSAHH